MTVNVSRLEAGDRADWEGLYHGYAEFYQVPMNHQILDTVWGWIHDDTNPFFGLIAKDETGHALGLMHCRQMASPLCGALETPLAPLWAFMLFAEMSTVYTVAGGIIILVALFGSQWYGSYKKPQGV